MSEFLSYCLLLQRSIYIKQTRKIMAYMSQEGYDKLVAELKRLESIERPKASAAIAEARDKGDLSENSEYDAAKEAQAHLESKINKMKLDIAEAKIVDVSRLSADAVQIMSKVEMTNMSNKSKMVYTIVSESEANLKQGKISIKTPIAQGLLNHKVGDVVEVPAEKVESALPLSHNEASCPGSSESTVDKSVHSDSSGSHNGQQTRIDGTSG